MEPADTTVDITREAGAGSMSLASSGSADRVPEADRKMIFHVCYKLAVVLGLNAQEQAWLESLGATFPKPSTPPSVTLEAHP